MRSRKANRAKAVSRRPAREAPAAESRPSADAPDYSSPNAETRAAHLAAIVEYSNDAIYSRTLQGQVTSWNAAAERMYGFSAGEMIGRSSLVLEPPGHEGEFLRLVAKIRQGETVRNLLTERRRKDGRILKVSLTVSPMWDEADRLIGISTIARDITRQVEMQTALRRREQELADLFHYAPCALIWAKPRGGIERLNQAAEALLGCAKKTAVGQPLGGFFVYRELFEKLCARLEAGEEVRNFQTRLRAHQGAERTVLLDAKGLWEEGRLVHTYWFARDISVRKRLEREVLAIGERERQRLARELHDGLGQHLSGAAYLADSLREQLGEKRLPEAEAAGRLTRLVEESIQLTRDLVRGLLPVRPEPEGLMAALRELAARTDGLFQLTCRYRCPKPVNVEDQSAATHLFRIAQEAVHNAIRHGKATRINIRLSQNTRRLSLTVRDNGVGIRLPAAPRQGLGLQIMSYRAGLIHGSLAVQKHRQGGTEVVCTVDLLNLHLPATESAAAGPLNEFIP